MKQRMLDSRLARLGRGGDATRLCRGLRGLEKESLRVDRDGYLSRTSHPQALGSALTHPYLTTDYSEALPELVTPPYPSNWETLQFLCDLHTFMSSRLGDEILWAQSMPCRIPPGDGVPIARYGTSNIGQLKTVYRRGLGHRYGRTMQTISGVHFNYSLPPDFWPWWREREQSELELRQFVSGQYMGAIRNYRRFAWLLIYLFGASPAVCKSFPTQRTAYLEELDGETLFAPFGTSLRMSDIGYRNRSQSELQISMNSLDDYLEGMVSAVTSPHPRYEEIGVLVDGVYRQLNANTLQFEAEYYSPIRPKPSAGIDRRSTVALREDGVAYLEVRTLDLNMMDPLGVNQVQLRFIEALLIYCLLVESPPINGREQEEIDARDLLVAREGRRPGLELPRAGGQEGLRTWAREILAGVREVAALLDEGNARGQGKNGEEAGEEAGEESGDDYVNAVDAQVAAVAEPELVPSAQILHHMRAEGASFFELALETSRQQHRYFQALRLSAEKEAWLEAVASDSLANQSRLEAESTQPFADYLRDYFAQV